MKKKTFIELITLGLLGWSANEDEKERENIYESGRQTGISESKIISSEDEEENYYKEQEEHYYDSFSDRLE
jgi:hypothetical protein